MRSWAADIYVFFARRRLCLLLLCLLGLAWSCYLTYNLSLDKSLASLLPDSSASLKGGAEVMDLAPFARTILVQLTAENEAAARLLPEAADAFLEGLAPELMRPVDLNALPEPAALMALLPALCDADCRELIERKIEPEQIKQALAETKNELAGTGGAAALFWRADPLALRTELFKKFPARQSWPLPDPFIGHPLSNDGRHLLLVIRPEVSMNDTAGSEAVMKNLETLSSTLPPGLSAQIVGAQRHTAANAGAIERDLALTLSLAMALILAIYVFLVRSFGAFWLFLTPAVAVLAATAGLVAVFPLVSGLALGFGAAVLGIAEDYAVHVHYALRRSADQKSALTLVASPLFKSCLVSLAGFGVLLFSTVPAIRQLAFFSALAILIGYLWAMLVLPHCPGMNLPREFEKGAGKVSEPRRSGPLVWLCFAALLGMCFLLGSSGQSLSVKNLGLANEAILSDQESVEKIWRLDGGRCVFLSEGASLDEALALAGQVAADLNQFKAGTAVSLASLLPPHKQQEENLAAWRAFTAAQAPALEREMARSAEEAGFEPAAFQPFLDWFEAPGAAVSPPGLASAGLGPLVDNFLAQKNGRHFALVLAEADSGAWEPNLPGVYKLSAAALEKSLSRALSGEKKLLPVCVLICLGLLAWSFKSPGRAALAFIPALGGLAAVLLYQKISGRPLGLVETACLPLLICLGADYGIVVVSEFLENADLGAPKAIFISGLSTIAGIGILILARHPVLHALGRTVFIGLAAAMPISILLLPRLYYGWKKSST